jgi:fructan beta-fructosidase
MPRSAYLMLALIGTGALGVHPMSTAADDRLPAAAVERFAALALACVHQEYPSKIAHVLQSNADIRAPRDLTPAFYGCYDWHSAVHGHWLLARLARLYPDAPFAGRARQALAESLTPGHIAGEVRYLEGKGRASFERPYGLAWLLQLDAELAEWGDPDARVWAAALHPLAQAAAARFADWLPKLTRPIRVGEHDQTAFALGLAIDWARGAGDPADQEVFTSAVRRFYLDDRACPLSYEPSGEDFLSPCLAEGDTVGRVLPAGRFATWLDGFLPGLPREERDDWLEPGVVTDPSDPKLAHLDGLNLSRAWMLEGIAARLPKADPRVAALLAAARRHRDEALAHVTGEHYEGGHWLGTFATYLVTGRGLPARQPAPEEALRPRIHFTPPRNFMNDPNGLVFYEGEYHLFYQHNPFGQRWGHMSWGHAVSTDLFHWQHLPVALAEENGVMIFSGSAVVDRNNSSGLCRPDGADRSCLVAIYTGHGLGKQTQNLAYSNDRGRTWTKFAGNPVLDLGLKEFRDPKVFWHQPTARWIMVTVLADQHKVRLFGSRDLVHWDTLSDFGPAGATGGAWECPDLLPLPVKGASPADLRWVLVVNINPGGVAGGSGTQYFVGSFDGRRFVNQNPAAETLWADYGKDFYASQSFSDVPAGAHRRIWMGWISNWLYANDEPTVLWRGAQSVPRTLALARFAEGFRLVQAPVAELDALRTAEPVPVGPGTRLPATADIEVLLSRGDGTEHGLRLFNDRGEEVIVGATSSPAEVFVDRRRSRLAGFHPEYPGRHAGPARWHEGRIELRVLFDRSVVEVFAADGGTVISDRVYPTHPLDHVELVAGTAASGGSARLWTLGATMP